MANPTPPWADRIPEGAFITTEPTYPTGKYQHLFSKDEAFGLKYYYFDPTQNGFPKKSGYPLLIFLHGLSNALVGDLCINYTGAEMYASPKYQEALGGAYILIPVANEYTDDNGRCQGGWDASYTESVMQLIDSFVKEKTQGVGVRFLLGNSAGARFTFHLASKDPGAFDVLVPVGTSDIPGDEVIDEFDRLGVTLFYADGMLDEIADHEVIEKRRPRLESMKHSFIFTPDFVYNGDKGIASINFGFEMGQHCLMNGIQADLMFDDGTPMYPSLPNGMTGWMAEEIKRRADSDPS